MKALLFLLNLAVCFLLLTLNLNKFFEFENFFREAFDYHHTRSGAYYYFELDRPYMLARAALPLPLTGLWTIIVGRTGNPWFIAPLGIAAAPLIVYMGLACLACAMVFGTLGGLLAAMTSVHGLIFLLEAGLFFAVVSSVG